MQSIFAALLFNEVINMRDYIYLNDVLKNTIMGKYNIIFGRHNIGKTYYLLDLFNSYLKIPHCKIIVIDSATEHKNKSLIHKVMKLSINYVYIPTPNIGRIANKDDLKLSLNHLYPCKTISSNNDCDVFLLDLSFYLEKSLDCNDANSRNYYFNIYQKLVTQYLYVFKHFFEYAIIIMDEIEFNSDIIHVMNEWKNITVFSTIHDISYVGELRNYNLINADIELLRKNNYLLKSNIVPCGNFCGEIVAALFYLKECRRKTPMFWIADIASSLLEHNIPVDLYVNSSKLYDDYKCSINLNHPGISSLKYFENHGKLIIPKELFVNDIIEILKCVKCIIFCVSSSVFFNNNKIKGGHFIVVYFYNNDFYILNPQKTIASLSIAVISDIVNSCIAFGGWHIVCK